MDDLKIATLDTSTGTAKGIIELKWRRDWSKHPTTDLCLILLDPNGGLHPEGATLNCPEGVISEKTIVGKWAILVYGYEMYHPKEFCETRVTINP